MKDEMSTDRKEEEENKKWTELRSFGRDWSETRCSSDSDLSRTSVVRLE